MSITYLGIITMIIAKAMEMAAVQISTEEITKFIETGLVLFGGLIAFYGRFRKGDLTFFGLRK